MITGYPSDQKGCPLSGALLILKVGRIVILERNGHWERKMFLVLSPLEKEKAKGYFSPLDGVLSHVLGWLWLAPSLLLHRFYQTRSSTMLLSTGMVSSSSSISSTYSTTLFHQMRLMQLIVLWSIRLMQGERAGSQNRKFWHEMVQACRQAGSSIEQLNEMVHGCRLAGR